ncbi:MAG: hypothetical protein IRZ15_14240 [Bryobacteraceae bacterium]|nr:hypothetical protein [Bryobacteraceae bacterium]
MGLFCEDHEATINAARQIEDIVSNATVGWANESAKRQVKALIFSIQCNARDPYIREKAASLEGWIDILFSARKWQKYGGTDRVMSYVRSTCSNMASRAETLLNEKDHEG